METELTSKRHSVADPAEAMEFCHQKGWTDGLPVVAPTEERVRAMLAAARRAPHHRVATIEHRAVSITAEKAAINAVMAGCKPEYMPVVLAAIEAMADPAWNYHGPGTSTAGAAALILVNGPITRELEINGEGDLFGPGWRANTTIGRAVRLVMRNVCGSRGTLDRSTLGHPGRLSYVIAEDEAESPWPPFHQDRGFAADRSVVTVMAAEAPHQFYNQLSNTAEGILTTLCDDMRISGNVVGQPQYMVVLAGEHRAVIAGAGWSKDRIREYIFENAQNSYAHLKRTGRLAGEVRPEDETRMRPLVASPDDVFVVAAGGRAGAFSAYIPGWGSKRSSRAVSREIER